MIFFHCYLRESGGFSSDIRPVVVSTTECWYALTWSSTPSFVVIFTLFITILLSQSRAIREVNFCRTKLRNCQLKRNQWNWKWTSQPTNLQTQIQPIYRNADRPNYKITSKSISRTTKSTISQIIGLQTKHSANQLNCKINKQELTQPPNYQRNCNITIKRSTNRKAIELYTNQPIHKNNFELSCQTLKRTSK